MIFQIFALFMWGSSFIAAKYAYVMLAPALMVQVRLLIAGLIVLPTARRYLGRIPRAQWKPLLWLSFANYVLVLMLQFIGLKYTSAASAVTIIGLEPILMVFVGHFFFNDKAKWYHWVCGVAAFLGVSVMIAGGAEEGGEISVSGCLLVFLAGLVFALIMRPTQKLIAEIGAPAYTSVSLLSAAVLCLPFSLLLTESFTVQWIMPAALAVVYLGVGCSWFAYWLWNKGMNRVPANISGVLISMEPVLGLLMAVLLLGERVSAVSAWGMVIILVSAFAVVALPRWLKT
ncbi:EamA/RhaT family transporter [Neisseria weixii]|uniref:EamA/RhaT family transporter n=1 Tax=Neisseria weixii TaxID=1853276 RepID=A0A3N4MV94_9NEIS|nr:EamA family transporter [Neisseria weixii]RPD83600.1 EamA/RhaT family transporter [Neisseria weixii]RPD84178.1 EamA/RhaT family transporter [Neisseria weixii]